jgi:hypothetical protein
VLLFHSDDFGILRSRNIPQLRSQDNFQNRCIRTHGCLAGLQPHAACNL